MVFKIKDDTIIRKITDDDSEIKKGAIGIAYENKLLHIDFKVGGLTDEQKEELLKLLGDRAEEFFTIYRRSHRIIIDRSGIKYNLGIASPIYDVANLDDFEIINLKDLSEEDKKRFIVLNNEIVNDEET